MADAAAIADVHALSKQMAYRDLVSESILASICGKERVSIWQVALDTPTFETLVADVSGELVGFVLIGPISDSNYADTANMEIHALYISPERWRQGIGRALMNAAVARGIQLNYSGACLWTALPGARLFYESIGFTQDGAQRTAPLMKGVDIKVTEFLYRMDLHLT